MFIFGGCDGSTTNDLYEFNILTSFWRKINTKGKSVTPRYWHSCTSTVENQLFI